MGHRHVCTFRHAQRAAYRTAISAAAQTCFNYPTNAQMNKGANANTTFINNTIVLLYTKEFMLSKIPNPVLSTCFAGLFFYDSNWLIRVSKDLQNIIRRLLKHDNSLDVIPDNMI